MKQDRFFYMMTEDKIEYFSKIGLMIVALMDSVALMPLMRVAYHMCMGKYTPHSWMFLYDLR